MKKAAASAMLVGLASARRNENPPADYLLADFVKKFLIFSPNIPNGCRRLGGNRRP